MADGFTFLAVSADAFVVELDVHIQARSDGEEVSREPLDMGCFRKVVFE
jgi:hypothetical protein